MSNSEFTEAATYFNAMGKSALDDIIITYDKDENILIEQHDAATYQGRKIGSRLVYTAISGAFAAESTYKATSSGDWATDGPSASLAFLLLFGALAKVASNNRNKIIDAVDRNVTANKQQPQNF